MLRIGGLTKLNLWEKQVLTFLNINVLSLAYKA
jgi:hypothetical protein